MLASATAQQVPQRPPTPPPPPVAASENAPPVGKAQAKEIFRSVDEILSFVSMDSGLPIQHSIKRKLISREQVSRYLRRKFDEDESTRRMERAELVLKKFGLLDRDFQLRPFLLSLLTEQIAGFYDNKTKTVNLLDWIAPEEQRPVLAHELTHALQDQKVDLERWGDARLHDPPRTLAEDRRHIENDELETSRSAVAEGQAMVTFLDYSLRAIGKTVANASGLADRLSNMGIDSGGSPILARAPLLLQQSLLFPYTEGLAFERALLIAGGKDVAFAAALANPPGSTFQILHPDQYLAHAPVPSIVMPDIHPLLDRDYLPYDVGVMGELDVRILAELFGGREMAEALSPEWDGGIYYAAERKSPASVAPRTSTASLAIFYASRWKNPDSARSFLKIYAGELPRKYAGLERRAKDEVDEEQVYTTSEGDVLLVRQGAEVFVAEGFPLALARELRTEVLNAQPRGPVLQTKAPTHEPTLALAALLRSAGVGLRPHGYTFPGPRQTSGQR